MKDIVVVLVVVGVAFDADTCKAHDYGHRQRKVAEAVDVANNR